MCLLLRTYIHRIHSDKAGRSVPAPGRGALSIAREVPSKHPLPILDVDYRSRQLSFRRSQISQWLDNERELLRGEVQYRKEQGQEVDEDYFASRVADIEKEAARQEKDAQAVYGMLAGTDDRIAPLRRALAVWGLTIDDVDVLSIHGTSTGANVSDLCPSLRSPTLTIINSPGEERNRYLEQHLHEPQAHSRQRSTYHGPEELVWSLQGRLCRLAARRSSAECLLRYRSWQPQCRVSTLLTYQKSYRS